MNWDNLQYFLAVARTGSLSGAAAQLAVNHSTVARRVDKIEADLGVRLFDRLNNGYRLTQAGRNLLQQTQQLEEQIVQIQRRFQDSDKNLSGRITVSKPSAGILNLAPIISEFCIEYPNIKIELIADTAFSDLNRFEADVAIRLTESPPDKLLARKLGKLPLCIYADKTYLAANSNLEHPGQMHWLVWHEKNCEPNMQAILLQNLPDARIVLTTNSYSEVYEGINAGLGVGLLSPRRLPAKHDLSVLTPELFQHSLSCYILCHPELRQNAKINAFIEFFSDRISSLLA